LNYREPNHPQFPVFQEWTPISLVEEYNRKMPFFAKKAIDSANDIVGGSPSSLLTEVFRSKVAKMGLAMSSEAVPDILYPTGFPTLDYLNGYIAQQLNTKTGELEDYYNLGITDGSYVCLVANTSVGKSTLANQIIANIARPYPKASIMVDDIESGMTEVRRRYLSKFSKNDFDDRYIIRNSGITIENIYQRIKTLSDIKTKERPQDYIYDSGRKDLDGKPIIKMFPTLYLIDSIAALMPEEMVDEDQLQGKSYGAHTAAVMSQMMQAILQLLKAANIIVFGINHFSSDVQMTMFPKAPDVPWLKQGERIPKGKKATLLANNIYRMDNASKLKMDDLYHVEGSIVKVSLVKSRSSGIKRPINMVYDFINGFDPWLSMLEFLRGAKLLYGGGASVSFDPERVFKFSMGTFKDKINNDIEFRNAFKQHMLPILRQIPMEIDRTESANMHFDDILEGFY